VPAHPRQANFCVTTCLLLLLPLLWQKPHLQQINDLLINYGQTYDTELFVKRNSTVS
jgi:hypothetical protein